MFANQLTLTRGEYPVLLSGQVIPRVFINGREGAEESKADKWQHEKDLA